MITVCHVTKLPYAYPSIQCILFIKSLATTFPVKGFIDSNSLAAKSRSSHIMS